ncbi:protein TonB [Sphingopyxis sp. YR583]|uniref:TonB family protein n=1 Tax=Sphingopyxis sp. YR583 TaxID=1881047 RepID=UPI0008A769DD|nr:TonB family protein [Sphingopyxis sp. YR583]SEH12773.1 protein TonB [Sphingopyxis sp. YR583]
MIDSDRQRVISGICVSLAVHAGAAAALFVGFANATPSLPAAAMVIDMAPLPSAPAEPVDAMPQPEQVKAQPKPVVEDLKIPPVPKLAFAVKPEVAVPLKEEVKPNEKQAEKPAEETTPPAAPQLERKDAPKAPAQGLTSNSPSNADPNWEAKLLAAIQRNLRFPAAAQAAGQQDLVRVIVTIDRSGRLLDAKIKSSRGYALVDAEALAVLRRASPFPKPPERVTGDPIIKEIPIIFAVKRRR